MRWSTLIFAISVDQRRLAFPRAVVGAVIAIGLASALWVGTTVESAEEAAPVSKGGFRGVFFNPNITHAGMAGYPWPVFDPYGPRYRNQIRAALQELAREANLNFIDVFIPIPFTLSHPGQAPRPGQPIAEWANLRYLDNLALFLSDCHDAGISVEFDLADNRWIPYSVDSRHHIGRPGGASWPVADDAPWESSATWHAEIVRYVESRARHPENIAMWGMAGNYQWGAAEPCLWDCPHHPAIRANTEKFVKQVWPAFRSAGKRPKAAPILLPVFSNDPAWMAKAPDQRLSGFRNLKKWIVDDLSLPPDYWPMTTYPFCDPAPDGVYYLRRIVEILGKENASRVISTDFKGPGHDQELKESVISAAGHSGREMLMWHFQKCAQYRFAGWWIWSYQDQAAVNQRTGIRDFAGRWKPDLLEVIQHHGGEPQPAGRPGRGGGRDAHRVGPLPLGPPGRSGCLR